MAPALFNKLILVVDDEADLRLLACCVLRNAGARVIEAQNGKEGLAHGLKSTPDLILMDVSMPMMDGITAAAELRSAGYSQPIIAYTATDFELCDGEALGTHFDAKILKPCANAELVTRLSKLLAASSLTRKTASRDVLDRHAHDQGRIFLHGKQR